MVIQIIWLNKNILNIMINNNWTLCKYIELIINVQKKPVSLYMKISNKYQGKFLNYDSLRKKKKIKGRTH